MNYKKNLIYILIIFFSTISLGKSNENIAYIDLDNIIKSTKAGKSIINELKASKDSALKKFEKKEKALKKVEEDINKQKNVLSKEELKNKILDFREEIASFRNDREKLINDFNIKKIKAFEKFFEKITPIIGEYVEEKNIDFVLDKKNIFLANKNNDITSEIIKLIDKKIK
ncbi:OmpH family outer membrane protein [Pelagibacterales bacterium SAG-MED37]|nr:OmpH family outer membrane protein [Pelagibacterales bacterium SAG-MED37]